MYGVGDQVERNVDAAGIRRHGVGVLVDRVLVERVDLSLSASPPAERICWATASSFARVRPARKTQGAFPGERPSNRAADRSAPSVDHGVPVLEQHAYLLRFWSGVSGIDRVESSN